MKIIKPSYEILDELDGQKILKKIELCARTCYKSEDKVTEGSAERFIANIIKRGHESVVEHFSFTVKFIVDRAVSNQIERHRLASFSEMSTRYCNFANDKFGNEITVIKPCFWDEDSDEYDIWRNTCRYAEDNYMNLINIYQRNPEEARSVLPNSLATEVNVTANLREWRNILKQRTSKAAHPQIREVMIPLLKELKAKIPIIFDDILEVE